MEASVPAERRDPTSKGKPRYSASKRHPRFITDQTAISVGVDSGESIRIRNPTPLESEFHVDSVDRFSPTSRGQVKYIQQGTGVTASLDVWPKFEGSVAGSKSWRYKMLRGERHNTLECSSRSHPLHSATILYDNSKDLECLPQEFYTHVSTQFRLVKPKFVPLSETLLTKTLYPSIRHISVDLKATFKRTMLNSTFDFPAQNKAGGRIVVDLNFERTIGRGIPLTSVRTSTP